MNQGNGMYDKQISLIIGVHCHQPVGNFSHVFEDAWRRAYLPFLKILMRHPRIKISLHYSGVLLKWFKEYHPEALEIIQQLLGDGQVELMTGGFYEPVFTVIPDRDKLGQIEMMNNFLQKHFSFKPRGLWLAERIWEPQLPLILCQAGVEYSVVDDSHFRLGGMKPEEIFGYYLVEEQGLSLKVFPIDKRLRYLIPFRPAEETISYLRTLASTSGDRVAVIADDGEKFGLWPGTDKWVYEEKWLEKFFQKLEENADWIKLSTFSQYLDTQPARGNFYIPTASYDEMMEWSGGFFRNFFVKYPEANDLHKRMLYVSEKVSRQGGKRKNQSREELYRGQCNCAYWHGIFGGLYLKHLRSAVQKHLIQAERIADGWLEGRKRWLRAETRDVNLDGKEEILINSHLYNLYLSPEAGGSLYQLDYKPKSVNLLDTLTRRPETYHEKLDQASKETDSHREGTPSIHQISRAKEENLKEYLSYDWYRRSSLVDHFLSSTTSLDDFKKSKFDEQGDFVQRTYQYDIASSPDEVTVNLYKEGSLLVEERRKPVKVEKKVKMRKGKEIEFFYRIVNLCPEKINFWFGIEFNFSLPSGNTAGCTFHFSKKEERVDSAGSIDQQKEVRMSDKVVGLTSWLTFSQLASLWYFPLETISQSESGFERSYQGSVLLANWQIALEANENWELVIKQSVGEI